jgi:hypothetical protein
MKNHLKKYKKNLFQSFLQRSLPLLKQNYTSQHNTMDPKVEEAEIDEHEAKKPRRNEDQRLDLLHEFETGYLHDCTIRVGCDLQDSNSSFKV